MNRPDFHVSLKGRALFSLPRGEKKLRPKPLKQPSLSPGPPCAARDLENSLPNSLPAGSFAGADDSGSIRPGTAVVLQLEFRNWPMSSITLSVRHGSYRTMSCRKLGGVFPRRAIS